MTLLLSRRSLLAASLAMAAAPTSVHAQTLRKLRYGSVGGTTDAGIFIADDYGLFRQAGFTLDFQRLSNASSLIAALATNQLDVAGISVNPGLFAAFARGINLRVVGDKESILPNFMATQLMVRPSIVGAKPGAGDAGLALDHLVGKRIAVSARAASAYFLLGALAEKHGHSVAEYDITELEYPLMAAAFTNNAIDAAVVLEPYLSQIAAKGWAVPVSDFVEIAPASGASEVPMIYGEAFVTDRATGDAFMLAYMQAVRIYNDAFLKGTDKDRIQQLIATRTGFPIATIRDSNPVGFEPDQLVNKDFLNQAQHFFVAQHLLAAPIDIDRLVDPTFAQAAVKILGPYKRS